MKDVLYGIKLVVLEELDKVTQLPKEGGIVCNIETAESAEMESVVSEGEEENKRTDDRILAVVRTPDLLYGYDIKLTDNTFDPEIASLIEGGVLKLNETGEVIGYRAPMIAEGSTNMKHFRATIYVANYEGDSIKNYVKVICNNCSGTAPGFKAGKEFYAPEMTIRAREATKAGLPVKEIDYALELPIKIAPIVTSTTIGTLNSFDETITDIPAATTVSSFLLGISTSYICSKKINTTLGVQKTSGDLVTGDILVVFDLESGLNTEYVLTVV
jgi:hypothetical protein